MQDNIRHEFPEPGLAGAAQYENASAAIAALEVLSQQLPVTESAMREALAGVQLTGRCEWIRQNPGVLVDVAHNPDAAESLLAYLDTLPRQGRRLAVCAMLEDKDREGVVEILAPPFDDWFVADLDVPRGGRGEELARALDKFGVSGVKVHDGPEMAYRAALESADDADDIVVFGSFYTVAEVLETKE